MIVITFNFQILILTTICSIVLRFWGLFLSFLGIRMCPLQSLFDYTTKIVNNYLLRKYFADFFLKKLHISKITHTFDPSKNISGTMPPIPCRRFLYPYIYCNITTILPHRCRVAVMPRRFCL